MGYERKNLMSLEEIEILVATGQKKYVSYKEGAQLYSIGQHAFMDLAKDAGAVRKIKGRCLVNVEMVNKFIEDTFS